MQNSCAINWKGSTHSGISFEPVSACAPALSKVKVSRRAKWVFALGFISIVYAYAILLYSINPGIQHWLAVNWHLINIPGVVLIIFASGLIFSIPAVVMGYSELKAIYRHEIPRTGLVITWIGFLLAIASSIIFYIAWFTLKFVKAYAAQSIEHPFGW